MVKKIRILLLAILTLVCGNAIATPTTVKWVAADQGYANAEDVADITVDSNISLVANAGTNSSNGPKYYTTGTGVRLYAGNTFTVKGGEGVTVQSVVFTFGSGDKTNAISVDTGTFETNTWTGESQNVVFTIEGSSGHRRIASVEITYDVTLTEKNVTWDASSRDALPNVSVGNDLTLTWIEASGDQAPSYTTQSSKDVVLMRSGNKLTVAGAAENVKISKIVFTYVGDNLGLTANVGTTSTSYADNTSTWTGDANSITFSANGRRYIKSLDITYTGSAAPVAKVPVLAITNDGIADTYDMDANGVFVVYYENQGNAAAENAQLTLYVDGVENASTTIGTLNFGSSTRNFWNAKYDLNGLSAGEHQVYLTLTADNAETVSTTPKTVTFTQKAPEATFALEVTEAVTVPYGSENYAIVAAVSNTSAVDAENVEVSLQKNVQNVVEPQTISLAAGASQQVTFIVPGPFNPGQDRLWVVVKAYEKTQAQKEVTVTFEEAPVVDVKDLAVTDISGTLDLANESNSVRVIVQNNGNVDITDAAVTLKAGETVLGETTVSARAGQSGWCTITVASEGLTAGELNVTATVEVEGDATPEDNVKEATLTVKAIPEPEATFSITAENVTVAYGATSFDIVAKVKNTSEINASDVEIKLLQGITEVETKTVRRFYAGIMVEVPFTINAPEGGFTAGKTATYFVQVANQAQAEVTVTFEEAPVEQNVDMALLQVQGVTEINLGQDNVVMVWYKNNGNVETSATINAKLNGVALTAQTVENVRVEGQGHVEFTLPTEGLVAGEKATFEATIVAENDANAENNTLTREYDIVSGEAAPQAEIMINPIRGWDVQAGEQEINVTVSVFNQGDADAENVKIELYHSYGDDLVEPQVVNIKQDGYKMLSFKFNYTFEQGKSYDFTVFTNYADSDASDNMRTFTLTCPAPVTNVTISRIADITATTAEDVVIAATLDNDSEVAAKDVKVGVYKVEDLSYQLVGIMQSIDEIPAGEQAAVQFNLGLLEAGNYTYYVRVSSVNGNTTYTQRDVNVKVTEPVVEVVDVAISAIQGISNINLAAESNAISVWAENKGTVNVDATIAVSLNGTALEAQTVSVKAGSYGYAQFELPTEGLVAGQTAVVVATLTVAENTSEAVTMTREYDVVNSAVTTEPVFQVTAVPVELEFGTETFDVVAVVKNVSEIDAQDVEVSLFHNETLDTKTIATLRANAEAVVTFKDVQNPFKTAGEYSMYVIAPKAQAEVKVVVKPEPVEEVVAVALSAIQGISNIDLAAESNAITVWAENKGTVDADATIGVSLNGTALEAQTVNVKAGSYGFAQFVLPTEGLVVGEKATIVATVAVAGNTSEETTLTREYDIVNSAIATEPVFQVYAENVTVEYGAEYFELKAVVKNTSSINATGVEVRLLKGITEIATTTISTLEGGAEQPVVFQVEPTEENPFVAGTSATYYVQVSGKAQAEVKVIFKAEPVEEFVDLAVTAIQGSLSLDLETNYLTVFVQNNGNTDATGAFLTLTYPVGDEIMADAKSISVKAGSQTFATFEIPAANLTAGEFTVNARVEITNENWESIDVDESNNELSKTYTIEARQATLSFVAYAYCSEAAPGQATVRVYVTNSSADVAAENVEVLAYSEGGVVIGSTTVDRIEAGATKVVSFVATDESIKEKSSIQVAVNGETKWVNVEIDTAINGIETAAARANVYTLEGKRAGNLQKGATYIINGKKTLNAKR